MPVTIEQTAPCRKTLRVEVSADRVAGKRAEILQEFRRVAAIPGFRPGKAPEPMVEKRYASEIDDEVRKRLIPDTYREALNEHNIQAVGYPEIKAVESQPGQSLRFVAIVDTAPEFALPDYKEIPLTKKEIVIADEEMTRSIDALRDQQAESVSVEGRGIRTGDFAVINYTGVVDGKPIADM